MTSALKVIQGGSSVGVKSTGSVDDKIVRESHSNEIIIAVVGHVGSGTSEIAESLEGLLGASHGFEVVRVKARKAIEEWADGKGDLKAAPPKASIEYARHLQDLGDAMRRELGHSSVARLIVKLLVQARAKAMGVPSDSGPVKPDGKRRAYVIDSLRHPAEVMLLRAVYRDSFGLVGVVCDEKTRIERLVKKYHDGGHDAVVDFMARDAKAPEKYGQRVSDAFHLSDYFIDNTRPRYTDEGKPNPEWDCNEQLSRFVKLIEHSDVVRPTDEESAMHAAYGASLRSACLSRQVGAAVVAPNGSVISTGANEVPKAGGGVYGDAADGAAAHDHRCAFREGQVPYCSNTVEQISIIKEVVISLASVISDQDKAIDLLKSSRITQLLEFSRAVHAEMDALLAAGRRGAQTQGARLFVTTYPCHYCARHVVAAGIDEVQYIEPYPKSRALDLHGDAIYSPPAKGVPPSKGGLRVLFRPFTGIAPRSYARAFLKDRDLKNAETGVMEIGLPLWGSPWDVSKLSYSELEHRLTEQP